ncbi:MAG TPA: carboxypeptidase regulatory-like domain-containing protein, partial [Egicoccus sp.]
MRISLSPELSELAPGQDVDLLVTVVNDGEETLSPTVGVSGFDPQLVSFPEAIVAIAPGGSSHTVVRLQVSGDALPGEQRIGITVTDPDGYHPPASVSTVVVVGSPPDVLVELKPSAARGRRAGKLDAILRNTAAHPVSVQLEGSGNDVDIDFWADEVDLDAGEVLRVPTRIKRRKRSWFREVRHGALIRVRGNGVPVSATATYTQLPFLPPLAFKLVAAVTALAVWAAAVVFVHGRMTAEPVIDPATDVAAGEDGADGEVGAGEEAAGEGGEAADAGEEAGEEEAAGPPIAVAGTVEGPTDPSGTEVVIERIAFGDEGTTSGQGGAKLAALTPVTTMVGSVIDKIATTTDEGGRFRFSGGLAAPAYYRVTAVRPGFELASQVVQTTADTPEFELAMALVPADGGMNGRVTDDGGRGVGGATVTVTDGVFTFQTTSATEGTVGSWSLEGMATPSTYQVIVVKRGYATATRIDAIEGGQSLSGVDTVMLGDLGTVRGQVSHRGAGVGAVTVQITGDNAERTTTTLTQGGLTGFFDFPALPYGDYDVTLSADGWMTQTTSVTVDRGDVMLHVRDLTPSTAIVQGVVEQQVGDGCEYPDPDDEAAFEDAQPSLCGGVGVSLIGDAGTYRTTTATDTGSFQISGVPAGEYTLAFERQGYYPEFYDVSLAAGDVVNVPDDASFDAVTAAAIGPEGRPLTPASNHRVQLRLLPKMEQAVGEVVAVIRSVTDAKAEFKFPANTKLSVLKQPQAKAELLAEGGIKLTGLMPGAHTLRVDAPGYDVLDHVIQIARDGTTDAGTVVLTPLATMALRVTDGAEFPISGAQVFVTKKGTTDTAWRTRRTPTAGVSDCSARKDAADRWRIGIAGTTGTALQGLCVTVNTTGDAVIPQAFGTGDYQVITPANESDIAAQATTEAQRRARAGVVPLDHQQLVRDVSVTSGETSRFDLRARRYAIIEGRVREPSEDGYLNVSADAFVNDTADGLPSFPNAATYQNAGGVTVNLGISLAMSENGAAKVPPGGLGPRLSYGPAHGLPEGVYRINRVLPDDVNQLREFDLGFYNNAELQYDYVGSNQITALGFGETRVANAVLNPAPIPVTFEVYSQTSSGTRVPAASVPFTVRGITEYVFEGGGVFPLYEELALTSGASGLVQALKDGEPVRFLQNEALTVQTETTDAYYFFDSDAAGAVQVTPKRGENTGIRVQAKPRRVTGSVGLVPVGADPSDILDDLTVQLRPIVTVDTLGAAVAAPTVALNGAGDRLNFDFASVTPDNYRLVVTGPGVFDYASADISILPGNPVTPVAISSGAGDGAFLVDRSLSLDVTVTEEFEVGSGNEDPVVGATVELYLDGDLVDTPVVTDTAGAVAFTGLRGGPDRDYHLVIDKAGYYAPADSDDVFTISDINASTERELVRFGAVAGTAVSWLTVMDTPNALVGATVTLLDDDGDVVAGVSPKTTAADGGFAFTAADEIPAGDYRLRFTATDHETTFVDVTIADATAQVLADDVEVRLSRVTVSGTVTDDAATPAPMQNVRVSALRDNGMGNPPTSITGVTNETAAFTAVDGTYTLEDLPPIDLVIRFEEYVDVNGTLVPSSRRIHEIDVQPDPGDELTGGDVQLTEEHPAMFGTVTGVDFDTAGAPSRVLGGVTVTAECVSGNCSGAADLQTTTDAAGDYEFTIVPTGQYRLTYDTDGYDTLIDPADPGTINVIQFADAQAARDVDLLATPVTHTITVSSALDPSLESVTVTAVYQLPVGVPDPPDEGDDDRYVFSGVTDANGEIDLVLPPGDWALSTSGADAAAFPPRPHRNVSGVAVGIAVGDAAGAETLTLDPYVLVSGIVTGRNFDGAPTAPLDAVVVTPSGAAEGAAVAASAATTVDDADAALHGAWSVYLPPPVTGDKDWVLTFARTRYDTGSVTVRIPEEDPEDFELVEGHAAIQSIAAVGGIAPELDDTDVVLTASPVEVAVSVLSADDDQPDLDGITVEATFVTVDTGDATPAVGAPYDVSADSVDGVATLVLAPG